MTPCLCDPKGCGFEVRMKSHSRGKRNKLLWKAGLQLKEAFLSKVPVPHLQQWNELSSWSCFSPQVCFSILEGRNSCKNISQVCWGSFSIPGREAHNTKPPNFRSNVWKQKFQIHCYGLKPELIASRHKEMLQSLLRYTRLILVGAGSWVGRSEL